ncbi:alpha/beta hydrolase [Streptomyces sp. NPDC059355]|uniref:alpha/beta hydrolase n=1 Tax=Streptomyces sp. NPDC059355 TaxID=3346811 RepID=UPI0036AF582F
MAYAYDRELAAWAAMLPPVDHSDPDGAREQMREPRYQQPLRSAPEDLWIAEVDVPGPVGAPAVPVRVYAPVRPADPWAASPAVLYFHGGGFVTGDLETGHDECVWTATALGAVVVNVAYRLAPQHPYPHALMDAHAALYWLSTQGESLGVDPARIAVAGEDAGAGIAASLCLLARERMGVRPCFQLLADPLLDDRLATPSACVFTDTPVLDRIQAANMWFHYVGAAAGGPHVAPYAAPGRADDLSGLPPAYVSVCEFDPARDEGIAYAERLIGAGVPTELHHYPGTFHGSASVPGVDVSLRMREDRVRALHGALCAPPPQPVPVPEPPVRQTPSAQPTSLR